MVRIEELSINGEPLKGWPIVPFGDELDGIDLDEESSKKLARIVGRPLKHKGARLGVKDEVKQAFKEARQWAREKRKELQEKELQKLADDSSVKIVYGRRYVFVFTESSLVNDSEWAQKTKEMLKVAGKNLAEEILGEPSEVDVGDSCCGSLRNIRTAMIRNGKNADRSRLFTNRNDNRSSAATMKKVPLIKLLC